MNLFDTICEDMLNHPRLKEWDINELKDLDDGFYDVLHDAIDSKKLKLSKKKPKI